MRSVGALVGIAMVGVLFAQPPPPPRPQQVFSGAVNLQQPQPFQLNVAIQLWTIRGGQAHASLDTPGRGILVVQVRTGTLTTVIGGRRQERKEGEFWTVPIGVSMGVETGLDTAILQTVWIGE